MVMTVHSLNSVRIVCCIRSSVSMSTAAVASSKIRIFVLRRSVRAKQTSCLCPTLKKYENFSRYWGQKLQYLKERYYVVCVCTSVVVPEILSAFSTLMLQLIGEFCHKFLQVRMFQSLPDTVVHVQV